MLLTDSLERFKSRQTTPMSKGQITSHFTNCETQQYINIQRNYKAQSFPCSIDLKSLPEKLDQSYKTKKNLFFPKRNSYTLCINIIIIVLIIANSVR